jgi:hypothetical protein
MKPDNTVSFAEAAALVWIRDHPGYPKNLELANQLCGNARRLALALMKRQKKGAK